MYGVLAATTTWIALGTLAAALFSAVAAGAAWAAVRQAAVLNRDARRPLLHLSTTGAAATGKVHAHIRNGGGGVARQVWVFMMFEGRSEVMLEALPPEGMLAPGHAIRLELPWSVANAGQRNAMGLVLCTDAHGDLFAWAGGGAMRHWRARRLKRHPVTNLKVVRSFFPEVPDPEKMVRATWVSWEAA